MRRRTLASDREARRRARRDRSLGTRHQRRGPPIWYRTASKESCDCDTDVEQVRSEIGYSDFGYFKVRCTDCGETWVYFIEG